MQPIFMAILRLLELCGAKQTQLAKHLSGVLAVYVEPWLAGWLTLDLSANKIPIVGLPAHLYTLEEKRVAWKIAREGSQEIEQHFQLHTFFPLAFIVDRGGT